METTLVVRNRRVVFLLFCLMLGFATGGVTLRTWLASGLPGAAAAALVFPALDLNGEMNLPALYQIGLLVTSSALLALAAGRAHEAGDGTARGWWLLAAGFVLLAIDESWSFHERLVEPVDAALKGTLPGFLTYSWVLPGMAGVAAVALVQARFLLRLRRPLALRLVASGAVYLGGCIGMEMVSIWYALRPGHAPIVFYLLSALEEALEMSGAILLIRVMLAELSGGAEVMQVALRVHGSAAPG